MSNASKTNTVKIRRGDHITNLQKVPNQFIIHLETPCVYNTPILLSAVTGVNANYTHIKSLDDDIELFSVADSEKLDPIVQQLRNSLQNATYLIGKFSFVSYIYFNENEPYVPNNEIYFSNLLTIEFKEPASQEQRQVLYDEYCLEEIKEISFMENAYNVKLKNPTVDLLEVAWIIGSRDDISCCEVNMHFRIEFC